ncbi:unnamed protein product, partial [Prorocentrum cordatum]
MTDSSIASTARLTELKEKLPTSSATARKSYAAQPRVHFVVILAVLKGIKGLCLPWVAALLLSLALALVVEFGSKGFLISRSGGLGGRLQVDTDRLEDLLKRSNKQKERALEVQAKLGKGDKEHCDIVAQLAGDLVQPKAQQPKTCLARLVNSEIGAEELFDTAAFFDIEEHEATEGDKQETKRRMSTMQEAPQKRAKDLFSGALASVGNTTKEHLEHKNRMAKKRENDSGEGT